jgi:hypothetical protein
MSRREKRIPAIAAARGVFSPGCIRGGLGSIISVDGFRIV